jgi:hypothetical protein
LLAIGFGGAGVAAYFMLKRWSRAGAATAKAEKKARGDVAAEPKRDALDDRLDRELADIENRA